jgi:uncharacterized protein (DUF1697 family)
MAERYFAFLRAINTGRRRLTNDQLLAPFHDTGLTDVAAYQAAGNVTFRCDRDPGEIEVDLAASCAAAYGFDAPVFVRTAAELVARAVGSPFPAEAVARSQGRAQITFMATAPDARRIAEARALVPADDHVVFVGREWLWLPRGGVGESALPVTQIERIVGPMTMRSVGTVQRMLARFPD